MNIPVKLFKYLLLFFLCMANLYSPAAQQTRIIHLWPGEVPGNGKAKSADTFSEDHGGQVTRIARVTDPVLEIFEPEHGNTTGLGVIVCPGGGYQILAIDLEGYEVAKWLNSLGITAFVLHYRVPGKREGALQDAQRAMRLVKEEYVNGIPKLGKIGMIGFSAGASLSARLASRYDDKLYEPVDSADELSARPDFTLLIYPAYLDNGPGNTLTPELRMDEQTPPSFLFQTADDPYGNSSLVMAGALRNHTIGVELHLLPEGGHGYLRPGSRAAETWPDLAAKWIGKFAER